MVQSIVTQRVLQGKLFFWHIGMKVCNFFKEHLCLRVFSHLKLNTPFGYFLEPSKCHIKMKQTNNSMVPYLSSPTIVLEVFSKQKGGLGIFLVRFRINSVDIFEVWAVNSVMQFRLGSLIRRLTLKIFDDVVYPSNERIFTL